MLNKNANVIYMDSDEKHVGGVVLYADDSDFLYWDEDCTKPILSDDIINLHLKGLIKIKKVYNDETYYDTAVYICTTVLDINNTIHIHGGLGKGYNALVSIEETEEPSEPTE